MNTLCGKNFIVNFETDSHVFVPVTFRCERDPEHFGPCSMTFTGDSDETAWGIMCWDVSPETESENAKKDYCPACWEFIGEYGD